MVSRYLTTSLWKKLLTTVNDSFSNNFYSGKLSRKDLYDLRKRATAESSFIFDNKFYKQIDGFAMGSPLGPTMANAFLVIMKK